MGMVMGVGIPVDGGLPTGRGGGNLKMVERSPAAQNHLSASDIGVVADSCRVGE
jgi:hypothetical protein